MSSGTVHFIKAFHYLTTPIGICFLLLILSQILSFCNKKKLTKITLLFALFFLWFCATPLTSNWLFKQYNAFNQISEQCADASCEYDTIIVAGYMEPYAMNDPKINQFWSERLWLASKFAKKNTPIIVISSQYPKPPLPREGEFSYAKHKLLSWGITESKIFITKPARTTRESMLNAYQELIKQNAQKVLIVGYHLRLTRKLLSIQKIEEKEHHGFKFIPTFANHDIIEKRLSPLVLTNWLPTENCLLTSKHVLHEFAALIAYRMYNWI